MAMSLVCVLDFMSVPCNVSAVGRVWVITSAMTENGPGSTTDSQVQGNRMSTECRDGLDHRCGRFRYKSGEIYY